MTEHKGWHDRGYLPHFDAGALIQHVVFRLHGSLPASLFERLRSEANPGDDHRFAVDQALDVGHGPTWLSDPTCADIVAKAMSESDGLKYELLAWCVMPNHVHVLIRQIEGWPLGRIIKSWKGYTARMINRHLGRSGTFWATDYFDRYVRTQEQHIATIAYIEANPVTTGLCQTSGDWPWSSARARPSTSAGAPNRSADLEVRAPSTER